MHKQRLNEQQEIAPEIEGYFLSDYQLENCFRNMSPSTKGTENTQQQRLKSRGTNQQCNRHHHGCVILDSLFGTPVLLFSNPSLTYIFSNFQLFASSSAMPRTELLESKTQTEPPEIAVSQSALVVKTGHGTTSVAQRVRIRMNHLDCGRSNAKISIKTI